MKGRIKKIEIPDPFSPKMEKGKFFDFKYDRRREKEEWKVVGLIILIMLIITAIIYSRTYYIIPIPLLAICFLLLYRWHCSKLKKKNDERKN